MDCIKKIINIKNVKNLKIIVIAIVVFFLINPISKHLVYNKGRIINNYKLPDIFHFDNFNLKSLSFLNEVSIFLIILFFVYNIYMKKIPYSDIILFIKYLTILMLIKIILMNVTILPDASGVCSKINKTDNLFNFYFMGGCNDLIFSLHMSIVLLILHFLKKNNIITDSQAVICSLIQALLTIFTHNHYTIDVLIAFIITPYVINDKFFI